MQGTGQSDDPDEISLLRLRVADLERELQREQMRWRKARAKAEKRENEQRASDQASRYGGRPPPALPPAVIKDGADLIATCRAVRQRRGWSHLELDQRIGWADGYTGKVEQPHRPFGRQLVAPALSDLLSALGIGLVAVELPPRAREAELPLPLAIEPDAGRVEILPYASNAEVLADVRRNLTALGINVV